MILLIIISAVCIASGGAQIGDLENCDTRQLQTCVEQIPKTRVGLPRTKSELDAHCQAYHIGMTCMDKWIKKCLPNDGQRLLQQQIGGARVLMHFLCTNDTALRREFLKEPVCWSRVSPDWSRCVDELQMAVREISDRSQLLTYVNKNTELCWYVALRLPVHWSGASAREEFVSCVAVASRACSTNAGTLLRRIAWILAQDVATCSLQPRAYCDAPPLTTAGSILTLMSTLLAYSSDFL